MLYRNKTFGIINQIQYQGYFGRIAKRITMDSSQIILDFYRSGELKKICSTITGNNQLSKDLEQEVVLYLLEKPESKIMDIHNKGYFKFYVVKMVMTLYNCTTTPFSNKYRHNKNDEYLDKDYDSAETFYNENIDVLWALAEKEIDSWNKNGGFPYEKEMLKLFMKTNNMREMNRLTKIPYRSICYTMDEIKKKLKTMFEQNGITGLSLD